MGEKCCGEVHWNNEVHRCMRSGRHEHNGKFYCKSHFPPNLNASNREHQRLWGLIGKGNTREKQVKLNQRRAVCYHAMNGIEDPHAFMLQVRYFVGRVYEMRNDWAEASPEKRNSLWQEVHRECAETFEMMNPTPAPSETATQPKDATAGGD